MTPKSVDSIIVCILVAILLCFSGGAGIIVAGVFLLITIILCVNGSNRDIENERREACFKTVWSEKQQKWIRIPKNQKNWE